MAAPVDRRLLAESDAARTHLRLAAALGLLSACLIVGQAALLAYVIERAAMHHATLASLRGELIALAAVLCARALTASLFDLSGRLGAARVMSEVRSRLVQRMLIEEPGGRPRWARTGELAATAVQGVDALEAYFAGYLPQLVLATAVPIAVIGWACLQDPIAAAILAVTIPILIGFMVLVGKGARERAQGRWRALALLGSHFLDVVQGLATLRAYGREDAQGDTMAAVGERYRAETMATLRVAFLSALVLELCAMIGTALVAATIGVQLVDGVLGLQAGLTVLLLAPEMYAPLRMVGQQFHASTDATIAFDKVLDVLDSERSTAPPRASRPAPSPALERLALRRVCYSYPGRTEPALDEFDLTIEPGEITALMGESGAGKSTAAMLLMRFAEPSHGLISCGEVDLRDVDVEQWRSMIAWVPQQPTIFGASVAENVALYRPRAGRSEIEQICSRVGVIDLISELPGGLDCRVGEGGRPVSRGQAQRIALARAMLARRPLLILDEPTAHLDLHSAGELAAAIAESAGAGTVLVLAHGEALAAVADHVLELDGGRARPRAALEPQICGAAA